MMRTPPCTISMAVILCRFVDFVIAGLSEVVSSNAKEEFLPSVMNLKIYHLNKNMRGRRGVISSQCHPDLRKADDETI